ncbi:hypothetical protein AURDEDRAFT_77442, partial [Auricularia subglabra TFB-10046 SS5]
NTDKYHPSDFGKVGMRHFHLTRSNLHWRPVILVIDTLQPGYGKVPGQSLLRKNALNVKACLVFAKAE